MGRRGGVDREAQMEFTERYPTLFALVDNRAATGVFLSMQYAPTWADAHPAVRTIQEEAGLGWLLRGLHHWGGTAAILLAFAELVRMFVRWASRVSSKSIGRK